MIDDKLVLSTQYRIPSFLCRQIPKYLINLLICLIVGSVLVLTFVRAVEDDTKKVNTPFLLLIYSIYFSQTILVLTY